MDLMIYSNEITASRASDQCLINARHSQRAFAAVLSNSLLPTNLTHISETRFVFNKSQEFVRAMPQEPSINFYLIAYSTGSSTWTK